MSLAGGQSSIPSPPSIPRALLDIPERWSVTPAARSAARVLGDVAGAEPVRRRRRRLAHEMDRVAREEHAHVVALLGRGAGDEQRERGPGWVLGTSGGMDE
jgi:hypothetical protein